MPDFARDGMYEILVMFVERVRERGPPRLLQDSPAEVFKNSSLSGHVSRRYVVQVVQHIVMIRLRR